MPKTGLLFLIDSTLESNVRAYKTLNSLSTKYTIYVFHRGELNAGSRYFEIPNTNYTSLPHTSLSFIKRTIFLGNDFDINAMKLLTDAVLNQIKAVYCVDLWTLPTGYAIAKQEKLKLIYDSYEICAETLSQQYPISGLSPKSMFFRFWVAFTKAVAKKIEKKCVKHVDLFITTSESYLAYFKKQYSIGNSAIVMNCPDYISSIEPIDLHKRFGIDRSKRIVLYIGWFNNGRKLQELISSSPKLEEGIHILFLGKGPLLPEMKKIAKDLSNISIEGPFEMSQTHSLIKGSDIGILLLDQANISKHNASANKVFDFMMSGIPMILSNSPENSRIASLTSHFYLVDSLVANDLAQSINSIVKNINQEEKSKYSEELSALSKNKFNWQNQEMVLLHSVDQIISTTN